jgi:hypothetical protein
VIHSNPIVAGLVFLVLFFATMPMARRLAEQERDQRLFAIVMASLLLHLLAGPAQIYFVDHYYHGISDYNRYVNQGKLIGQQFDHFNFSLAGTNQKFLGAGSVSVFAGAVFALVGVNKLAGFLIFGWFAFIGTLGFYRAYANTFPESSHRRYAYLIFFLPSLIFWTAGVSKESVMYLSIGLAADGASRILARKPRGVLLLVVGIAVGVYVRPQELLLFTGATAAATLFRPRAQGRSLRLVRFVALAAAEAVLLVVVITITGKLAKQGTPVFSLKAVAANNAGQSSSIPYHPGPKGYPYDIYAVLFDPQLFNAHSTSQRIAALENTVILVLILTSWRRLLRLPRVALTRPYVMVAFLDLAGFCYAFAALSNLGLIDRERTLVLPFLLVLLAIPVSPKGKQKQFPWEVSRRKTRRQQRSPWQYAGIGPPSRY